MSNTSTFEKLAVKELQDFLRERGVSKTGHTKAKLVKLAAAVADLSLPVDPDLAGPSHSNPGTVQAKLLRVGSTFSELANLPGFLVINVSMNLMN